MKRKARKRASVLWIGITLCAIWVMPLLCVAEVYAGSRGIQVAVKDSSGQELPLYGGSYAILIGVSDYTAGWPDLRSIPGELDRVEKILRKQGFHIDRVMNPDSKALSAAFEDFIDRYGFEPDNRLLFFFSGHGHTRKGGQKGYLVPVDAPDPQRDERGFLRKALPMAQILSWSRQMEAKHSLFLFDSCFSGTVFKVRALPKRPPHINRSTSLPVRQYITAGDAGDTVPAKSVFTPAFIDALEYGWADLNGDHYVSGTELGIYLQEKVPQHTEQTPQFGKIKDYQLSRGDYVFVIKPASGNCTLNVDSTPPGAKILIDGRLKGVSPLVVTGLAPGRVTVEASKEGYTAWQEQVLIREGLPLEVKANLERESAGGIIRVGSDIAQSRWYLDGIYAGRTPDVMEDVPPGTHRITVKARGYIEWSDLINVARGKSVVVNARLGSGPARTDFRKGHLYVDVHPSNARVMIMNIKPKYVRGMALPAGRYHLKVSAQGHRTHEQWVHLESGEEKHTRIQLQFLQNHGQPALSVSKVKHQKASESESAPVTEVFTNVKRAFKTWTNSILSGPSAPTGDARGDSDYRNPSSSGAP